MNGRSRREFLAEVGRGMLVASLGATATLELVMTPCIAEEPKQRLKFGKLEPLVTLMQETPPEKLLPKLVAQLKSGTQLENLVSAAALANARAFGGQDYTGYHTFMALMPAYRMTSELAVDRRALPVLKVLYRNSSRIQEQHVDEHDTMHPIATASSASDGDNGEKLRDAIRAVDWNAAESQFAATAERKPLSAFNQLQYAIQDEPNVHRVVLAWRAWAMLELAGQENAETLLRQSVRFCLDSEQQLRDKHITRSTVREQLPRLLDQHRLLSKPLGNRKAEDGWIEKLAHAILTGTHEQAADAAAGALAEGFDPEDVGEAISMAANLLVLHDPGRRKENSTPQKPPGCVHGDSVGVHASDAANAWRNIARISDNRNQIASLIVGAYHTAGQSAYVSKDEFPYSHLMDEIQSKDGKTLLAQVDEAIRAKHQARACAIVQRYGDLKLPPRPVFDLLLKYAVSEDGALHAEKYYRTTREEYETTRPAFRWQRLIALARVTASEFGYPAPGVREACEMLGVS